MDQPVNLDIQNSTQEVNLVPVPLERKKTNLFLIIIVLVVILLISIGGIYAVKRLTQPKACTLEAQICPDGSSIGRTGPNCEFAPCPTKIFETTPTPTSDATASWKTYTNRELKYEFLYPPDPLEPSRTEGDTSFVVGYPIKEEYRNDPLIAKSADKTFWVTLLGYIPPSELSLMGVTYCDAYPNDVSRCESLKVDNSNAMIDWGISEEKQLQKANASISHPNGGLVTFELQPVVPESKVVFRKILSTFKFTN